MTENVGEITRVLSTRRFEWPLVWCLRCLLKTFISLSESLLRLKSNLTETNSFDCFCFLRLFCSGIYVTMLIEVLKSVFRVSDTM